MKHPIQRLTKQLRLTAEQIDKILAGPGRPKTNGNGKPAVQLEPGLADSTGEFNPARRVGRVSNEERSECADHAFFYYKRVTGRGRYSDTEQEDVIDLIADLGHLCDRDKIDFNSAIASGRRHWEQER